MSLIEDAARRLEELRRAGADIPGDSLSKPARPPEHGATVLRGVANVQTASPHGKTQAAPFAGRRVKLDFVRLAAAGYVTPGAPRSAAVDEFRIIKRPLIVNAFGKGAPAVENGNLVMVSSALPGEGKTFAALNLALSIADELDRTVLLVDADVARPALPNLLGLPSGKGLLDVLQDGTLDVGQCLMHTNVPNLSILAGGTLTGRATELLASDAMARLLQEMAKRYTDRIIIFDAPPLLATTEAHVLASHMGQIVFVVKCEATTHSEVKHALATIEACPVKLLVLNMVESRAQGAYGYGYGYGYGHGSPE